MFSRILSSLVKNKPTEASSLSASFKDAQEAEELENEIDLDSSLIYRAAIYRLSGIEADLIRPSADLKFEDDAIIIDNDDDLNPEWFYESLLSVRQNIPESVQFVETQTQKEWGLHFSSPESAKRFRTELMNRVRETCDDTLAKSLTKIQKDYEDENSIRSGLATIMQRESDTLTIFCVQETPPNNHPPTLIVELTRDLHLEIQDVEKGEIIIWGPYENCVDRSWRRIWWSLKGLSENMLLVMTHSFGIEEKILRPVAANFDETTTEEESAIIFADEELKYLDPINLPSFSPKEDILRASNGKRCDDDRESLCEEWGADLEEECVDVVISPPPEECARHKFMEVGTNHSFVCRAKGVKNQWWDGQNRERDYEMHVMNTDAENSAGAYQQVISGNKFVYNSKAVNPTKALIPGFDDAKMMFVDGENDPKAVYHFDVEKEKVVSKYDTGGLSADILWKTLKGEQTGQTFMAASSDAFYLMDTRQQKANVTSENGLSARSYTRQYKTSTNFTAAASDAKGHIAIGNRTGVIRLYDGAPNDSGDFKIAKTQLDAKADIIKSIDTLQDGSWIVATMKECLVLYPTKLKNSEKTGFEMRLGTNKPEPLYLTLEPRDIRKYKLEDIDFRPAVFSENQDCIITSTGNLAIIWDLTALRKGKLTRSYTIKQTDLVIQETKATADGKVLVAHPQRVEILSTNRK